MMRWICAVIAVFCLAASGQPGVSHAEESAGGVGVSDSDFSLPVALSEKDRDRYRRIFALQKDGEWGAADRLIRQLDNRALMGHVLYQRYMHPTAYRSSYEELSRWLEKYADHPGAERVHWLAMRRKPYDVAAPRKPVPAAAGGSAAEATASRRQDYSLRQRREIREVYSRIRYYLRKGRPDRAEKRLWATARRDLLKPVDFDEQASRIAYSYLTTGNDDKALALSRLAAARSRHHVVVADWTAGLAAWRLGDFEAAYHNFAALARSPTAAQWTQSAGAFWGARAAVKAHTPHVAAEMLERAAAHTRTFYGLIANRQLGRHLQFSWDVPALDAATYRELIARPGVERALALHSVGRDNWADLELKLAWSRAPSEFDKAFMSLAASLNLPATQIALSFNGGADSKTRTDGTLYPMPDWQPEGGFELDRALIYAFIRQESHFNSQAKSWAGARGVMQLLPSTASYVARDRSLRYSGRTKLYRPEYNMALGQKYLRHLMTLDSTQNNLFLIAAAYNGGPGNLNKWLRQANYDGDWLLFIETIPARETRIYIERVLANFWMYRLRLGQPTPSLDAVAAGGWPDYRSYDELLQEAAHHAEDKKANGQN